MHKIGNNFNLNFFPTDMSQPSLSGLGDHDERERDEPTPPISPYFGSEGTSGMTKAKLPFTQKSSQSFNRKYQDSSLEADDTESELVAIPESDLSESTLHNSSVPGSFDDGVHFDELAQPLKTDQVKGKVTTANIATAQVALTTLTVAEIKEKEEKEKDKEKEKKPSRLFMKLNSLDKHSKQSSADSSKIVTKCSVQEGNKYIEWLLFHECLYVFFFLRCSNDGHTVHFYVETITN